jgi:hypothetical protein
MRNEFSPSSPPRPIPPLVLPAIYAAASLAALGWWVGAAATLIVGLPIVGALAAGIGTRRGLIVAAALILLGMTQLNTSQNVLPVGDLCLLSGLVAVGMVAGRQIESRIPRPVRLTDASEGVWMSVTVEVGSSPDAGASLGGSIPMPPLDDPERRSLHRRKNRKRALETAGAD